MLPVIRSYIAKCDTHAWLSAAICRTGNATHAVVVSTARLQYWRRHLFLRHSSENVVLPIIKTEKGRGAGTYQFRILLILHEEVQVGQKLIG